MYQFPHSLRRRCLQDRMATVIYLGYPRSKNLLSIGTIELVDMVGARNHTICVIDDCHCPKYILGLYHKQDDIQTYYVAGATVNTPDASKVWCNVNTRR